MHAFEVVCQVRDVNMENKYVVVDFFMFLFDCLSRGLRQALDYKGAALNVRDEDRGMSHPHSMTPQTCQHILVTAK